MFFEAVTEKDIQDHICCVEFFFLALFSQEPP